jgi:hypothetical protein
MVVYGFQCFVWSPAFIPVPLEERIDANILFPTYPNSLKKGHGPRSTKPRLGISIS